MKLKKMKIGKTELPGNLLLAPMADVTNLAFRLLCKQHGADFTYTEMISAEALLRDNRKSLLKGISCPEEQPFGVQLVGNSKESLVKAALIIEEFYRPAVIDVNMGCPVSRIVQTGCGSALLQSPEKAYEIIAGLSDCLETPVSAKVRILGKVEKSLEIARLIEKAGALALTVHGRTREQMYSGNSNLEQVRAIKEELSIPVIANGDIKDEQSAAKVQELTGCDGLMIGRAAIGNPYIFSRIRHFLSTGEYLNTDPQSKQNQQIEDFETYLALLKEFDLLSSINLKTHAQWFTKGLSGSRNIRQKINGLKDPDSIISVIEDSGMLMGTQ